HLDSDGIDLRGSGTWRRTYLSATGFNLFNGNSNKAGAIGYFKPHSSLANDREDYIRDVTNSKHFIGMGANRTHRLVLGYNNVTNYLNGYDPALSIDGDTGMIRLYTPFTAKKSSMNISLESRDEHRGDIGTLGFYRNYSSSGNKAQRVIFGNENMW